MTLIELIQILGVIAALSAAVWACAATEVGVLWGAALVLGAVPAGLILGSGLALLLIVLAHIGSRRGL